MRLNKRSNAQEEKNMSNLKTGPRKGYLDKIDKIVENIGSIILTAMFLVLTAVAIMQVVFRYALNIPLAWSEELMRYIFVWSAFLGAGVATARRMHIEVNIFSFLLDKKSPHQREIIERRIRIVATALMIIFLVYYSCQVMIFLLKVNMLDQYSTTMEINMLWPMSGLFVGSVLMLFHYIMHFVRDIRASNVQEG